MYTQRQLEICMKSAYSYENRAGWEKEYLSVEQIGMVQRGERGLCAQKIMIYSNQGKWNKEKRRSNARYTETTCKTIKSTLYRRHSLS